MSTNARNMEEIAQGGSHTFDITFLNKQDGNPVHPDGFDPGTPGDVSMVDVFIRLYTISTQVYSVPPIGYDAPTYSGLRYAGTKGKFLVDLDAPATAKLTSALVDERWAIEWQTVIGTIPISAPTSAEFFEVVDSGGAGFGDSGYATTACVRKELVQGLKKDAFRVTATGVANPTTIKLPDKSTEAVTEILVNGTETTAYTYDGLDTLTFSPVLTAGDVVKVTRDTKVSDECIASESVKITNLINSILGSRYSVPFGEGTCSDGGLPPFVKNAACTLTAMSLRQRFFGSTGQTPGDPHAIREWDFWIEQLDKIGKGELALRCADGTKIPPANSGIRHFPSNKKPVFSLEKEYDIATPPRDIDYPVDYTDRHRP